tara:strand:- start:87 stop:452 length:366 start_codon:yes stop_codon:yes gene_type:complete
MPDNKSVSEYANKRAFEAKVDSYLKSMDGKKIFPTNHPNVGGSNVVTTTVSFDGKHFILPSMVEGKNLMEGDEFINVAREKGLKNYPAFNDPKIASAVSKLMHGGVLEDGTFSYELAKQNF